MRSRNNWLVVIIILVAFSIWVDLVNHITITNPLNNQAIVNRDTQLRRGLDTLGGLQTLLQADVSNCNAVSQSDLQVTRQILESRANALGVSEIVMQIAGNCRIVAEFPGVTDPEQVVAALQQTALLEFVDLGSNPLPEGTTVQTDYDKPAAGTQPSLHSPGLHIHTLGNFNSAGKCNGSARSYSYDVSSGLSHCNDGCSTQYGRRPGRLPGWFLRDRLHP